MANHQSALKRIRQNKKRYVHNRTFRNRTRTMIKRAEAVISDGDLDAAREATISAIRDLDKLASRGIVKKENASRRKGRLMRKLAKLESAS